MKKQGRFAVADASRLYRSIAPDAVVVIGSRGTRRCLAATSDWAKSARVQCALNAALMDAPNHLRCNGH
jgi:hypothetical protein